jgi:2-methylcitrate dehydratase PrpD
MKEIIDLIKKEIEFTEQMKKTIRFALIDFYSVSIAALKEPLYQKVVKYAQSTSKGNVPLLGSKETASAQMAALSLGALGHALDYDDISAIMIGHPSVVLAPVLISLSYEEDLTGADLLEAYAIGYQTIGMISTIASSELYNKGWHTTSTIGVLGATMSACRLLRLTEEQVTNALGMACSFASGVRANFGTMTKPLHAGWAASSAILAARLAQDGFDSSEHALSAENSYLSTLGGKQNANFENRNYLEDGIIIKPYPSCGLTLRAIDCGVIMRDKYSIDPNDIESITCYVHPLTPKVLKYSSPNSGLEGKFSLEYCVASALIHGPLTSEHFTDEFVKSNIVGQKLIEKVSYVVADDLLDCPFGKEYVAVEIKLNNGEVIYHKTYSPKGYPDNPLSTEELKNKFVDCTKDFLDVEEQDEIFQKLINFDSNTNMGEMNFSIYQKLEKVGV